MRDNDEALARPVRRAVAQRPGPDGSRVHPYLRRKNSLPRLGDLSSITLRLRSRPETSPSEATMNQNAANEETHASLPLPIPPVADPAKLPHDGKGYETPDDLQAHSVHTDHSDDTRISLFTEKSSQWLSYRTPDSSPPTPAKPPATRLAANISSRAAELLRSQAQVPDIRSQISTQSINGTVSSSRNSNHTETGNLTSSLYRSKPVAIQPPQAPITPARPVLSSQAATVQVYANPRIKPYTAPASDQNFNRMTSFTQAPHYVAAGGGGFTKLQHTSSTTTSSIVVDNSPCPRSNFKAVYGVPDSPFSGSSLKAVYGVPEQIVAVDDPLKNLNRKLSKLKQIDQKTPDANIHIFVDMSNIFIGFEDKCREKRGIHKHQYFHIDPKDFLFSRLHHILVRDRPVGKKSLAGSVANAAEQISPPAHFLAAQKLDYKTSTMLRVIKFDSNTSYRRSTGVTVSPFDWTTSSSGDESGDGSPSYLCPRTKLGEQGVDENLHLAMQSSILDAAFPGNGIAPGVMVLATGDAKEAEFSEGFAYYAQKAMSMGWHVEVVSWKRCLSSIWKRAPFIDQFASQFRIIELDPFYEDMLKL
ncbi:hypothetical protein PG993_013264 [Apiospora rasikravindrae]|uniref:NYN domain-containing protein n=1 Tax=Apiospora rasikravindrae TaxID=990691 RepID=A0ABR1RX61_9PEZI